MTGERIVSVESLSVEGDDALIAVMTTTPPLVRSIPKRRYELGRSPAWQIAAFFFLGLPAIAVIGGVISALLSSL